MNKIFFKKEALLLGIFLVIFFVFINLISVSAEDDDEEDEEDEDDDRRTSETYVSQSPEVKTNISTQVITLKDSDGDGILDKEDPHPTVAEIYIVKDDNLNGIVDMFEELNSNKDATE